MRTNLPFILHRLALNLAESGTDVTLTWLVWPPGTTFDATTQRYVADATHAASVGTSTLKAFVHTPNLASSAVRQFNEIETGDVILDVAADADLEGKDQLTFTVGGWDYVAKPLSDRLAKSWDVIFRGVKGYRTLLLRRKT